VPLGSMLFDRLLGAAHEDMTSALLNLIMDAAVLIGTATLTPTRTLTLTSSTLPHPLPQPSPLALTLTLAATGTASLLCYKDFVATNAPLPPTPAVAAAVAATPANDADDALFHVSNVGSHATPPPTILVLDPIDTPMGTGPHLWQEATQMHSFFCAACRAGGVIVALLLLLAASSLGRAVDRRRKVVEKLDSACTL
jgi:hypothetical protein